jgi:TonB family protein
LLLVFISTSLVPALCSVTDAELQQKYGNQPLTFRQFVTGSHLHFDASGKPTNSSKTGTWTTDSQIRVQKISLEKGVLHIEGYRSFFFYDPWTNQMRDIGELPAGDPAVVLFRGQPKDVHAWYEKTSALKVSIECGNAQPEMDDIAKCINSVFLAPTEANETELAHANTRLAEQKNNPKKVSPRENPTGSATPMRVGNGVSPPRALRAPDPNYSQVAKSAGYQAKTVLWLIVDANGLPQNIKVERPVGLGLDDEAVKAVENWKFAPAMKDGSPVPVMINVEVNFRLY